MRIYLAGSHSSGKTTLAKYISKKYNLPLITEVARSILSEEETNLKQLRSDIDAVNNYQKKIFFRQLDKEKEYKDFVSDRSIDCLAYTAQHSQVLYSIVESKEYKEYIEKLNQKDSFIFFIRPSKETLFNDGVRENLDWDGVISIDAMIKYIFKQNNINYFQINTSNMQERIDFVDNLLNRLSI